MWFPLDYKEDVQHTALIIVNDNTVLHVFNLGISIACFWATAIWRNVFEIGGKSNSTKDTKGGSREL